MSFQTTKKVLITGGAGFLGSRLVRSFLESGMKVRVAGHLRGGFFSSCPDLADRLELRELDLCDKEPTIDAFAGQNLVIHTAAMIRANTPDQRLIQKRVNVDATRNVIEACRRNAVSRLLHVSSTAAIGISQDPVTPADENFRFNLDPLDFSYNVTKHQAEQLVLDANGTHLETVVVNPGFMFGAYQGSYRGREVIERVRRRRVVLCTRGGLSVVHVDDVVNGIQKVVENGRPGERYILSADNLSFREIARTVCRIAGMRRMVISIPDALRDLVGLCLNSRFARGGGAGPRFFLSRHYAYQYYSSEKARRELGYQPRSFARIVADAVDYIPGLVSSPADANQ